MSSHLVCADVSVDLPSYPSSAASFFKSKGLDLLPPLYKNFDCPFAFHIPFSVLLYTSWDGDLHFVLSKEFSVLSLFFKLSGIIPWRYQLSLASMSCSLSQLELAIFSPMCIALCLFELKFIFHFNTVNPVSSFCDCLQSATLVTTLKNLVASANLVMSLFASYSRFLMNMLRSMCPSTDPAGILQVCNKLPLWKMTLYCYLIYLQIFYFFLSLNQLFIHVKAFTLPLLAPTLLSLSLCGSNYTHNGMLLVTNAVICYIASLSFLLPIFLLFRLTCFLVLNLKYKFSWSLFGAGPRTLSPLVCTWVSRSYWSVNIKSRKCATIISDLKN